MFSLEQKNDTMFEIINDMIKKISILEMTVRKTLYNTATTTACPTESHNSTYFSLTENFPKSQPFLNMNNMKMKDDVILEELDDMDSADDLYDDLPELEPYEKNDEMTVTMTPMKTESVWNVEVVKTEDLNKGVDDTIVLNENCVSTEPEVKHDIFDVSKPYENDVYDDYSDEDTEETDDYSDEDADDYDIPYTDRELPEDDNDGVEYINGEFVADDDDDTDDETDDDEVYHTYKDLENCVDDKYDHIKEKNNELNTLLDMNDSVFNVLDTELTPEINTLTNLVSPPDIAEKETQHHTVIANEPEPKQIQIASGNLFPREIQTDNFIDNSISSTTYVSTDELANETETKENDGTLESINIKRKLTMQQLRSLVVSKGLVSDVSGLRKNDLIKLLDSSV